MRRKPARRPAPPTSNSGSMLCHRWCHNLRGWRCRTRRCPCDGPIGLIGGWTRSRSEWPRWIARRVRPWSVPCAKKPATIRRYHTQCSIFEVDVDFLINFIVPQAGGQFYDAQNDFVGPFVEQRVHEQTRVHVVHRRCAIWAPMVFVRRGKFQNVVDVWKKNRRALGGQTTQSVFSVLCHLPCTCLLLLAPFIHSFFFFLVPLVPPGDSSRLGLELSPLPSVWRVHWVCRQGMQVLLSFAVCRRTSLLHQRTHLLCPVPGTLYGPHSLGGASDRQH